MKYIVIHSQYLENYGVNVAGDADIWKFKGGDTFLVTAPTLATAIAQVQFKELKNTTAYVNASSEFDTLRDATDYINATSGSESVRLVNAYYTPDALN